MHALQLLALVGMAALTAGQNPCNAVGTEGGARNADNCCVCKPGYTGDTCGDCVSGFTKDAGTGRCGSGKQGMACKADMAYPFFGCTFADGTAGSCSTKNGESVFPCYCGSDDCDNVALRADGQTSECYPYGARMFTTFPNRPVAGEEFDITVVGCQLQDTAEYLLLPPGYADECYAVESNFTAAPECSFISSDASSTAVSTAACADQPVKLVGFAPSGAAAQGMSQNTFRKVQATRGGEYKLCHWGKHGWTALDAHDDAGRTETLQVCSDISCGTNPNVHGGAANGEECECEDGLLLGACWPTWLVIVLFLLLAMCLCGLIWKSQDQVKGKVL